MAELLVYVRRNDGETVPVELSPAATVADLRSALEAAQGSPFRGVLAFQGHRLTDDRATLADIGCGMEAVVDEAAAAGGDFVFCPELCCGQLEVLKGGKRLQKIRGHSWASCALRPPLPAGSQAAVHFKLTESGLNGYGAVGLMEWSGAGVPASIGQSNNWGLTARVETYYWACGWGLVRQAGPNILMPKPVKGDVITLEACIRPGGDFTVTAQDGRTVRVPIQFRSPDGTPTRNSVYAFYATLNDPMEGIEIVSSGSGSERFESAQTAPHRVAGISTLHTFGGADAPPQKQPQKQSRCCVS